MGAAISNRSIYYFEKRKLKTSAPDGIPTSQKNRLKSKTVSVYSEN
jgi:hypothetical protein